MTSTPVSETPAASSSLARKILGRSIDLLVIGFLLTVGLSIGQQLIQWWHTDPGATIPGGTQFHSGDLDWSRTPVTLRFGDAATALERIPFQGTRDQLWNELTNLGQSIVNRTDASSGPIDEAEQAWLGALKSAPPVMWESARGNVYRRQEPLPSFVATRFVDSEPIKDDAEQDGSKQRIVGWGLAFPTSSEDWTIYVFHPRTAISREPDPTFQMMPPEGSRNLTDLQGVDGSRWQIIEGRGKLSGWVQQFDSQFGEAAAVSRAIGEESASLKYRIDPFLVEIQLRHESEDRLTGVIWSARERESR